MIVFVTGASASGKSELAENLAIQLGQKPRCYLATMHQEDEESKQRISRHQKMRMDKGFETLEREYDLFEILDQVKDYHTILLECLTNLVANELFMNRQTEEMAVNSIKKAIEAIGETVPLLLVVSGEVFSDGGKYDPDTCMYLRVLGSLNQIIARQASVVVESVYGMRVVHKGKEFLPDENIL